MFCGQVPASHHHFSSSALPHDCPVSLFLAAVRQPIVCLVVGKTKGFRSYKCVQGNSDAQPRSDCRGYSRRASLDLAVRAEQCISSIIATHTTDGRLYGICPKPPLSLWLYLLVLVRLDLHVACCFPCPARGGGAELVMRTMVFIDTAACHMLTLFASFASIPPIDSNRACALFRIWKRPHFCLMLGMGVVTLLSGPHSGTSPVNSKSETTNTSKNDLANATTGNGEASKRTFNK